MGVRDLVPRGESGGPRVPARRRDLAPYYSLQREIDRLFNDFLDMASWPFGERSGVFSPRVNVSDLDTSIEVTVELPGLDEKDIEVTLARDTLTIKGEKKQEREDRAENYFRIERSYGSFSRSIPLPTNMVELEKVEAVFKNGLLTVTIPKLEEAQEVSKRIEVKAV